MIFNDSVKISGHLRIKKNGVVIFDGENLIVTDGIGLMASRMADDSDSSLTHLAIGDDTTVASIGQTALINELFRSAITSKTHSGAVTTYITSLSYSDANFVWKELGMFNDATAGTMFNRVVVNINKTASDAIDIQWDITFTGA